MFWLRVLLGVTLALNAFLLYRVVWSDQGIIAYQDMQVRYEELEKQLDDLEAESLNMSEEIRLLKSDRPYLEKMIRQQMHFVKKDEILYVFPKEPRTENPGAGADEPKN